MHDTVQLHFMQLTLGLSLFQQKIFSTQVLSIEYNTQVLKLLGKLENPSKDIIIALQAECAETM